MEKEKCDLHYAGCKYLKGFRASVNPRFEGGTPDFMDQIPDSFYGKIQYVLIWCIEKVHCWNPTLKFRHAEYRKNTARGIC